MKYNPDIHHRSSIRLKGYDYSQPGAYFVTLVTHQRQCLFGQIVDGKMQLNEWGEITNQCWMEIPIHYPNVLLDAFVIMPNHVHGIIILNEYNLNDSIVVGVQNLEPLQQQSQQNSYQHIIPKSIGSIVRGFKIGVTQWFRQNTDIYNVWQRNYYEHIIRNEKEMTRIREYIMNNPLNWITDKNCKI
jgi:REP element-mobilizing transposase RayT